MEKITDNIKIIGEIIDLFQKDEEYLALKDLRDKFYFIDSYIGRHFIDDCDKSKIRDDVIIKIFYTLYYLNFESVKW